MSEEQDKVAAPGKSGKARLLVLVVLPLALLLVAGGAAAYLMDLLPIGDARAHEGGAAENRAGAGFDPAAVAFVDLPDLLVNLNITGPRLRFLKFAAALEVAGEAQARTVEQFVPRIADNVHLYLRALTPEEMEGAQGVYRIKRDLLARINQVVQPAEVRDVLIKEMLVQ